MHSFTKLILLATATYLTACSTETKERILVCGFAAPACAIATTLPDIAKGDADCSEGPKITIPPQVNSKSIAIFSSRALPWLDPVRYPTLEGLGNMSFEYIAPLLAHTKFEKVELKAPSKNQNNWIGFSELINSAALVNWVSLSIQPRGAESCKTYEATLKKYKDWLPDSIRKSGINDEQCISVNIIEKPTSQFGFDVIDKSKGQYPEYYWQIRDLHTNSVYAQLVRYHKVKTNCPLVSVREEFVNVVSP